MTVQWGTNRISNLYYAWTWQLKEILRRLGCGASGNWWAAPTLVHLDYFDRRWMMT
jgi:hypothetical protein